MAKGLLDNDSALALTGVDVVLKTSSSVPEDTGRESQVEETVVGLRLVLLKLLNLLVQLLVALRAIVGTLDVAGVLEELLGHLLGLIIGGLEVVADSLLVLILSHFRPCVADDFDIFGQQAVSVEAEQSRVLG